MSPTCCACQCFVLFSGISFNIILQLVTLADLKCSWGGHGSSSWYYISSSDTWTEHINTVFPSEMYQLQDWRGCPLSQPELSIIQIKLRCWLDPESAATRGRKPMFDVRILKLRAVSALIPIVHCINKLKVFIEKTSWRMRFIIYPCLWDWM